MKIPKSVEILGQTFKIEMRPSKTMKDALGWCAPNKNRICLVKGMPEDREGEVFIHEVLHAIEKNLSLKLSEKDINNLALGVYGFLKNNGYLKR